MCKFEEYYYIFKNRNGTWDQETNPVFIANNVCKAIKKTDIKNIGYLIKKLNSFKENKVTCFLQSKFNLY